MGRTLVVVAVCLLAASTLLLLAGASDLLTILGLAGATVAGVGAWANERSGARVRAALEEKRRGEMAERTRLLEHKAEQQRAALTHERQLRLRTERARQAEREWSRELREQVLHMYRSSGPSGDLRELVLEVAVGLTGAEKGLLLSQSDGDGDGKLDLVCHRGFKRDPGESSVAQRFAECVVERDTIIREDAPGDGHAAADDEIDSLVAVPVYIHDDFEGVVICANRPGGFEELDDDVLLALGGHAGAVLENHRLHGRLRSSYLAVVGILADAIEAKDPFARASSDEVSACLEAVGRRLDFDSGACERLVFAGVLRDIGKLGISDRVLLRPGPLSAEERKIAELHPLIGCRIVERVPGLAALAPTIRHHHERWDGGGYPAGLAGEEIPHEARVIAVADTYSALTSTRPYRRCIASEEACAGDRALRRLAVRPARRERLRGGDAPPRARRRATSARWWRRSTYRPCRPGASATSPCSAMARWLPPTTSRCSTRTATCTRWQTRRPAAQSAAAGRSPSSCSSSPPCRRSTETRATPRATGPCGSWRTRSSAPSTGRRPRRGASAGAAWPSSCPAPATRARR